MLILTTKKLTTPLRSVVQPEWLKALNDGIKQERRVRQQHRTESLKTLNDGISTRFYVRQSLVVGTATTIHSIDCIRYLSTTTKCQPEMPDYVNNNIWGTSQLLRSTRYQVSGRKKDREWKKSWKKKRKMKNETKTNMHALREQAESGSDKVAVCWRYGESYDVSSWWTAENDRNCHTNTAKMKAETKPKKTRVDRTKWWVIIELGFVQGVSRWSGAWYRKIRYIEILYHIYIPNFWDWYGDIGSRRFISRYRTLFFAS